MKINLLILILCFTLNNAKSIETKIIHNIQNEIITNIDIKNEFKYLVALNNSLNIFQTHLLILDLILNKYFLIEALNSLHLTLFL